MSNQQQQQQNNDPQIHEVPVRELPVYLSVVKDCVQAGVVETQHLEPFGFLMMNLRKSMQANKPFSLPASVCSVMQKYLDEFNKKGCVKEETTLNVGIIFNKLNQSLEGYKRKVEEEQTKKAQEEEEKKKKAQEEEKKQPPTEIRRRDEPMVTIEEEKEEKQEKGGAKSDKKVKAEVEQEKKTK
jgi:hypothetical protein